MDTLLKYQPLDKHPQNDKSNRNYAKRKPFGDFLEFLFYEISRDYFNAALTSDGTVTVVLPNALIFMSESKDDSTLITLSFSL